MNSQTPTIGRRSLLAGMAALPLAAAVGCGTGGSRSNTSGGGGGDRLTVWFPGNNQAEVELVTKTLIPQFEQEHDVEVSASYADWAEISPKLNTAFAGGTAPDIFGHGAAATAGFADAGRVLALDDLVAELPSSDVDDLGNNLEATRYDGSLYHFPLNMDAALIVYRKDLFAEVGLDPESPPSTWEDVRAAARQLTVRDGARITRYGLVIESGFGQQPFLDLLASAGGELLSADGTASAFASEAGVSALTFLQSLFVGPDAVCVPSLEYSALPPAQHAIATGEAAMYRMAAPPTVKIAGAKPELADQIGVIAPPRFTDGAHAFGGPSVGLFISADSQNTELSWEFLKFMGSSDVAQQLMEVSGAMPARASLAESDYVASNPLMKPFIEHRDSYVPNPNVPAWVQVRDVLNEHISVALAGEGDPAAVLDTAAGESDELLAG